MYKIVRKKQLSEFVDQMVIEAPYVARRCEPGQFVILSVGNEGERVPMTIQDYSREDGTVTIIYQVVGYSTTELRKKKEGDSLPVFFGPLGIPAHYSVENPKRILGIGGGVGIAPLYPQVRKFKNQGAYIDVILGGRSSDLVILKDEFEAVVDRVLYATDDGSLGTKGFVTTVFNELLAKGEQYDLVIAIGPMIMMRNVVDITKPRNIPTGVSLNPIMIDGTGMCGGCRVDLDGETKFACVDGPDFDGLKVNFDSAMRRQEFYKDEEHVCRLKNMKG